MKKLVAIVGLLSALMNAYANPLSQGVGFFGSPFLLEENPSLMALSDRIWSGIDYELRESDGMQSIGVAYIHPIKKNALSLQYSHTLNDATNRISSGFGFNGGKVLFGSAMHLFINKNIGFTLDLSASYTVLQKNYVSINFKNILITDTIFGKNFREASLHYSSVLSNRLRLSAQSFLSLSLADTSFTSFKYAWYGYIEKTFLFDPSFLIYMESKVDSLSSQKVQFQLGIGGGWQMNIGLTRLGFLAGLRYSWPTHNDEIYGSIVFTPSRPRDKTPPRCDVSISNTTISLGGNNTPQHLLLKLSCEESSRESGVAEWILKISSGTWHGAAQIRTYVGGGPPPSSIIWNMLNASDKLVVPGEYFIQLIGVDVAGNVGKTIWKKITVIP